MVAEIVNHDVGHRNVEAFGPGSILWEIAGDVRGYLSGASAGVMQGLHPVVAAGIDQHSTVLTDPYGRALRSLAAVMRWVYGGQEAAEAERQWLIDMHKDVKGIGYDGERYSALTPGPYAWVWATSVPAFIQQVHYYHRIQVTPALEERLYAEMKQLARILGVNERYIPATLADFWVYWDSEVNNTLTAAPIAFETREMLRTGGVAPPPGTPRALLPAWRMVAKLVGPTALRNADFLAGAFMPPRARELLDIRWTGKKERRLGQLAFVVRNVVPLLPEPLRYTPIAYKARRKARALARHEARAFR